jgi:hypothetical protein
MDDAQPGQADRQPVEPVAGECDSHCAANIEMCASGYNITLQPQDSLFRAAERP